VNKEKIGKHGVQSMDIGLQILQVIVNGHRGMMLKEIASAAAMPVSKVHRYLVSMVRSGLVEQNQDSSKYDLGPFALNIGLVAFGRLDRIQVGLNAIAELCAEIDETTALSTWSPNGPIVIRWERPKRPVTVGIVTGTALEMITTVSGRVFGAYLAPETYAHLIQREIESADIPSEIRSHSAITKLFADIRQAGLSIIESNHMNPGVAAIGVPVFNARNEITFVMSAVGFEGRLDTNLDGNVVKKLKAHSLQLSTKLGYRKKDISR
jgi:DNA-binding IclR family transcriptional regulator